MANTMIVSRRRTSVMCLLLSACMTLAVFADTRAPIAQAAASPSGLPSHFGIGLNAHPDSSGIDGWMPNSGIPWDYAYQYLSGGVNTGSGWETWNSSGQFALYYAQGSASHNYIPVFPYYELLQSSGTCGTCPEAQKDLSNLNNTGLMSAYYQNFALLMQRLGPGTNVGIAGFGKAAIVQVEPDFSGYAEQAVLNNGGCFGYCTGQGNNPTYLGAAVQSSGYGAVAAYPNTYQGFNWALLHLRDLYAPNVMLAFHISNWATGTDVGSNGSAGVDATGLGDEVGAFAAQSGITGVPSGTSSYDLLFNDVLDRDAAYDKYVYGDGSRFWDRLNVTFPNFQRWEAYIGATSQTTGRSVIVWQIPEGNQYYDTVNNTNGHYQDNRAEYFFSHIAELQQSGIIGLLFGAGNGGSTNHIDSNGDGITNPASFCTSDGLSSGQVCNTHSSSYADDDGGYIRLQAQAYFANVGSATATATPTLTAIPSPTATATDTPSATPTITLTSTPTSTPGTSGIVGNTSIGSATDSGDANYLNGSRFTTGASSGLVTSMSVHVGAVDAAPHNQFELAIYSDSNGVPGALLARSVAGSLTANAWNTVPVSTSLSANAAYWLVYNTNGTSSDVNNMHYVTAGGVLAWSNSGVAFDTWPSTFPSSSQSAGLFSLYATFTTGNATATPTATPKVAPAATVTLAATVTPTATNSPSPTSTSTPTRTPTPTATRMPTITPMATATKTPTSGSVGPLGYTTVGASTDSDDSNYMNGSRFTMGSMGGTVTSMKVYVGAVGAWPRNQYQVAIYNDQGGSPGTLVVKSGTGTLAANRWNTISISATLTANTPYWLMYNTTGSSGSVNNLRYDAGGVGASSGSVSFGNWPNSFGSATLGTWDFSMYVTYR